MAERAGERREITVTLTRAEARGLLALASVGTDSVLSIAPRVRSCLGGPQATVAAIRALDILRRSASETS